MKQTLLAHTRGWYFKFWLSMAVIGVLMTARFTVGLLVGDDASSAPLVGVAATPLPEPLPESDLQPIQQLERAPVDMAAALKEVLAQETSDLNGNISIHVSAANGSWSAGLNDDAAYNAASLYKTLAAYFVLQRVDAGELSINQQTSEGVTLEACIERSIVVSDNPCGKILQALAQPWSVDAQMSEYGYNQTTLSGSFPQTSAQDQTKLMLDVYSGRNLSSFSQQLLLGFLSEQEILNRTPDYKDATVYVKTGDLGGVVNVSSLVETADGAYAVSIISDNWNQALLRKYSALIGIQEAIHEMIITNEAL